MSSPRTSRPADGPKTVVDIVNQRGIAVDVLVNNAGYGLFGSFLETSLDAELAMIHLNVVALTDLTKRLLPPMVARKSGRILNRRVDRGVSTRSADGGVLRDEGVHAVVQRGDREQSCRCTGVTVTVLAPGPTASGFQAAASLGDSKLVAGKTLDDVARGRPRRLSRGNVRRVAGNSRAGEQDDGADASLAAATDGHAAGPRRAGAATLSPEKAGLYLRDYGRR